jgi:phospholipid/cholesterol/gamma-HCH transport system substrate-binding protein
LSSALIWATAFPYGPSFADTITRGDYINLIAIFDLTYPRLKKTLFLGTRWGDENAKLIPAPGDPYYLNYSYTPMSVGLTPPPDQAVPPPTASPNGAPPPISGPVLPVAPPPTAPQMIQTEAGPASPIFAGPYGADAPPADPAVSPPDAPPAPPAPGGGG